MILKSVSKNAAVASQTVTRDSRLARIFIFRGNYCLGLNSRGYLVKSMPRAKGFDIDAK